MPGEEEGEEEEELVAEDEEEPEGEEGSRGARGRNFSTCQVAREAAAAPPPSGEACGSRGIGVG